MPNALQTLQPPAGPEITTHITLQQLADVLGKRPDNVRNALRKLEGTTEYFDLAAWETVVTNGKGREVTSYLIPQLEALVTASYMAPELVPKVNALFKGAPAQNIFEHPVVMSLVARVRADADLIESQQLHISNMELMKARLVWEYRVLRKLAAMAPDKHALAEAMVAEEGEQGGSTEQIQDFLDDLVSEAFKGNSEAYIAEHVASFSAAHKELLTNPQAAPELAAPASPEKLTHDPGYVEFDPGLSEPNIGWVVPAATEPTVAERLVRLGYDLDELEKDNPYNNSMHNIDL